MLISIMSNSTSFYRSIIPLIAGLFFVHNRGILHKVCRNGLVRRVIWLEMYCILELIWELFAQ